MDQHQSSTAFPVIHTCSLTIQSHLSSYLISYIPCSNYTKKVQKLFGGVGCDQISTPPFYAKLITALPEIQLVPRRQKKQACTPTNFKAPCTPLYIATELPVQHMYVCEPITHV